VALVRYTSTHEWLSLDDHVLTIGITHRGSVEVGEVIQVGFPEVGTSVDVGNTCVDLRFLTDNGAVRAPLAGEVIEINAALRADPTLINRDPEGEGWMLRIRLAERDGFDDYFMPKEYLRMIAEQ